MPKPVTVNEAMETLISLHENLEDASETKDMDGKEYRDCKRARLLISKWRREQYEALKGVTNV